MRGAPYCQRVGPQHFCCRPEGGPPGSSPAQVASVHADDLTPPSIQKIQQSGTKVENQGFDPEVEGNVVNEF